MKEALSKSFIIGTHDYHAALQDILRPTIPQKYFKISPEAKAASWELQNFAETASDFLKHPGSEEVHCSNFLISGFRHGMPAAVNKFMGRPFHSGPGISINYPWDLQPSVHEALVGLKPCTGHTSPIQKPTLCVGLNLAEKPLLWCHAVCLHHHVQNFGCKLAACWDGEVA